MIIPEDIHIGAGESQALQCLWENAAREIGMTHGVYVMVESEYTHQYYGELRRIYFKIDEREFDSITTLERALRMKAFL